MKYKEGDFVGYNGSLYIFDYYLTDGINAQILTHGAAIVVPIGLLK